MAPSLLRGLSCVGELVRKVISKQRPKLADAAEGSNFVVDSSFVTLFFRIVLHVFSRLLHGLAHSFH